MFAELLPPLAGETEQARRQLCWEDIMRLNGKQTIYQMLQLADRIKERYGIRVEFVRPELSAAEYEDFIKSETES